MIPLSCRVCRTELTAIALTDADESRAANSGETCCAAPESPAGRLDPISLEAVVGGLAASGVHDADPDAQPPRPVQQAATVDRPSMVAATHRTPLSRALASAVLVDVKRNLTAVRGIGGRGFLSGVPGWVQRRVGVL